jgi:serine/threonine protein kinase
VNLTCGRNPWKKASLEDSTFRAFFKNSDFLKTILPLSPELNEILKRIFEIDPQKRITLPELRHAMYNCPRLTTPPSPIVPTLPKVPAPAKDEGYYSSGSTSGDEGDAVVQAKLPSQAPIASARVQAGPRSQLDKPVFAPSTLKIQPQVQSMGPIHFGQNHTFTGQEALSPFRCSNNFQSRSMDPLAEVSHCELPLTPPASDYNLDQAVYISDNMSDLSDSDTESWHSLEDFSDGEMEFSTDLTAQHGASMQVPATAHYIQPFQFQQPKQAINTCTNWTSKQFSQYFQCGQGFAGFTSQAPMVQPFRF